MPSLDPKKIREIVKDVKSGLKHKQIAQMNEVTVNQVRNIVDQFDLGRKYLSVEDSEIVASKLSEGMTTDELCLNLKLTIDQVKYRLKKIGLTITKCQKRK